MVETLENMSVGAAVGAVVDELLARRVSGPLVIKECDAGAVELSVGLPRSGRRITATEAARLLDVSARTFRRHSFYGLKRDKHKRFSLLQVQRLRDQLGK